MLILAKKAKKIWVRIFTILNLVNYKQQAESSQDVVNLDCFFAIIAIINLYPTLRSSGRQKNN
jgi:hypothetical protein